MMIKQIAIATLLLLCFQYEGQSLSRFNNQTMFMPSGKPFGTIDLRLNNRKDTVIEKKHSPHKATIYSAILPGLGQAYNRKYWKIPIIYAGLGISGYLIGVNRKEMIDRQNVLKLLLDNDSTTIPTGPYADVEIDQLKADRNLYRTNRDYSIITFAAFYVINIVDAAIDAHFYKFNIDKPLSQRKTRHWYLVQSRVQTKPVFGLAYRF
ncbi:MAG: DUF5683 domain-containing protein [Bacteroidota bacterium]